LYNNIRRWVEQDSWLASHVLLSPGCSLHDRLPPLNLLVKAARPISLQIQINTAHIIKNSQLQSIANKHCMVATPPSVGIHHQLLPLRAMARRSSRSPSSFYSSHWRRALHDEHTRMRALVRPAHDPTATMSEKQIRDASRQS
jgi:hypothetical protein